MKNFDKYAYYLNSVQSPAEDVVFFEECYYELIGNAPTIFREDFCAAFALSCEWVKRQKAYKAIGVDLDEEPLAYGRENYLAKLTNEQKSRVEILQQDVLSRDLPSADIVAATNFSYFAFKDRPLLLKYLINVYETLNKNGLLILDCFGGVGAMEPNEHETEHDDFSYFWDQDTFNPITNESMFYIHFKRKGEPRREKVFAYDWRLWGIPELRDLLTEAGFTRVHVYWEGTSEDGEGDGVFSRTNAGDDSESWIAYIVAEKR